jgi:dihydroorotase-like cyclic amidohydrolase
LEKGCPVYIVHVSSKETIDVIRYLRQRGAKIYAETCPHYLTLTKNTPMGVLARMAPPLRSETDIECLWQAVADGTFDTIGSDHVPLLRRQKEEDGIWKGVPGVGGIGAILPLMMTEGVNKRRITIERLVKLISENPARIWGIYPKKGALSSGSDADIIIVDPSQEWVLSADNLKSRSDYSIYEGRTVKGKVIKTFVRGKLVAEDGTLVAETPLGEYVKPLQRLQKASIGKEACGT